MKASSNQSQAALLPSLCNLEVLYASLADHHYPLHFHDTYVVEWVVEGRDECSYSGQSAGQGQLFVHGPGIVHDGQPKPGARLKYHACYPAIELVEQLLETNHSALPQVSTLVVESSATTKAVESLFAVLHKGANPTSARGALEQVLLRVFDASSQNQGQSQQAWIHPGVQAARQYLLQHLSKLVTSEELAQVSGLSRFHLIRQFKRCLGITPRLYQLSQRISLARSLLVDGRPIADVAHQLGFSDQSHLTRDFKRLTSLSPGQLARIDR